MYYLAKSKRTIQDNKGNDKSVTESFLIDGKELFAEAEYTMLQYYNSENDVVAISRSQVREFINTRDNEEEEIYMATIESIFVDDKGDEKSSKYLVGVFSDSVQDATKKALDYMKSGLDDMKLIGVKKTKIIDVIK